MAEEKLIILVFAEAVFVLIVTIAVLVTYIFSLKKKSVPTPDSSTEKNEATEDNERNWPPAKFLSEEIKATNSVYFSLVGTVIPATADATMSAITDKKLLVMQLRYYYLQAELEVLNIREDFEAFWGTLTQSLLSMIPLLPSSHAGKEELAQLHTEFHHLKNQCGGVEVYQQAFFLLQSLVRIHLSSSSSKKLLPLTQEISLLKTGNAIEILETQYKAFFEEINALLSKQAPSKLEEPVISDGKNQLSGDIVINKLSSIVQLQNFLDALRDQKSLPNDKLNQFHNLIISLTDAHKSHEKQLAELQHAFNEAQMCNAFLETELTSSQETVRSLLEIIEGKSVHKSDSSLESSDV